MEKVAEILLLALPWVWIAAAALVLAVPARRARRPGAAKAFGLALAAYGVSDFFVTFHGRPALWLVAWKGACILVLLAVLVDSLGRPASRGRGE